MYALLCSQFANIFRSRFHCVLHAKLVIFIESLRYCKQTARLKQILNVRLGENIGED